MGLESIIKEKIKDLELDFNRYYETIIEERDNPAISKLYKLYGIQEAAEDVSEIMYKIGYGRGSVSKKKREAAYDKLRGEINNLKEYVTDKYIKRYDLWSQEILKCSDDELNKKIEELSVSFMSFQLGNIDLKKLGLDKLLNVKTDSLNIKEVGIPSSMTDAKGGINYLNSEIKQDQRNLEKLENLLSEDDPEKKALLKDKKSARGRLAKIQIQIDFFGANATIPKYILDKKAGLENEIKEIDTRIKEIDKKAGEKNKEEKLKEIEKKKAEINKRIEERKKMIDVLSNKEIAKKIDKYISDNEIHVSSYNNTIHQKIDDCKSLLGARELLNTVDDNMKKMENCIAEMEKSISAYNYRVDFVKETEEKRIKVKDAVVSAKQKENALPSINDMLDFCRNAKISNVNKALVMAYELKGKNNSDEYKDFLRELAHLSYDFNKPKVSAKQIALDSERVNITINKYLRSVTVRDQAGEKVKKVGLFSNQETRNSKVNLLKGIKAYMEKEFVADCFKKGIKLNVERNDMRKAADTFKNDGIVNTYNQYLGI